MTNAHPAFIINADEREDVMELKYNNIREAIEEAIELYPNNIAFRIKSKIGKEVKYTDITYKQMQNDIYNFGTEINSFGKPGNIRIAVIGNNSYEWAITYLAAMYSNNVVVTLDKGLPPAELEELLIRSKAEAIVFEDKFIDTMKNIQSAGKTQLKHYICMRKNDEFRDISSAIKDGKTKLKKGDKRILGTKIDNKKMASLIFTSGTTSASKAVMLSQYNIASDMKNMKEIIDIRDTDVNMAFIPFHHTYGSTGLMLFLSKGTMNIFIDGLRHIQSNLVEYKVSIFVCVPLLLESMYKKIMNEIKKQGKEKKVEKGIKLSRFLLKFGIDIRRKLFKEILDKLGGELRYVVCGAAALDKTVAERFNDFGIVTVQGYGLTETSPVVISETEKYIRYGSIGKPILNVEAKIDNPNEEGIGEIVLKTESLMLGYYENEEETNKVIKDGWFYTGDLAYKDKDGYFYIAGREKNVIVLKNGKNIYPEELETLIAKLPYIDENMVYGRKKDDDLIVAVKVVYNKEYVKEHYPNKTEEELHEIIWKDIKEINKNLTNYKHIKHLTITDEPMIKTSTAKIKRFEEIKKIED